MKVRDYTLYNDISADQVLQRELRQQRRALLKSGLSPTQAKQQIDSFKVAIKIETERLRQLYADDDGVA